MNELNGKTIMIVDDKPDMVSKLTNIFEDKGFGVINAADGKECLNRAMHHKPDVITINLRVGSKSGFRTVKRLREDSRTKDIPVVMVSGVRGEFEEYQNVIKKSGKELDYLEMPKSNDEIIEKISMHIRM